MEGIKSIALVAGAIALATFFAAGVGMWLMQGVR